MPQSRVHAPTLAGGEVTQFVCPNCETALPVGCAGLFKGDGTKCWMNDKHKMKEAQVEWIARCGRLDKLASFLGDGFRSDQGHLFQRLRGMWELLDAGDVVIVLMSRARDLGYYLQIDNSASRQWTVYFDRFDAAQLANEHDDSLAEAIAKAVLKLPECQ